MSGYRRSVHPEIKQLCYNGVRNDSGGSDMERGLWRDGHWAQVSYEGIEAVQISRALYERRGYQPPFDELPTKEEYETRGS